MDSPRSQEMSEMMLNIQDFEGIRPEGESMSQAVEGIMQAAGFNFDDDSLGGKGPLDTTDVERSKLKKKPNDIAGGEAGGGVGRRIGFQGDPGDPTRYFPSTNGSKEHVSVSLATAASTIATGFNDEKGLPIFVVREALGSRSTLLHDHRLELWGITISKDLKVSLCGTCGLGLKTDAVSAHLRRIHKKREVTSSLDQIVKDYLNHICENEAAQGRISSAFIDSEPRLPVQGLRIQDGFVCTLKLRNGERCNKACPIEASIKKHITSEHGGQRKNSGMLLCYETAKIQTVFGGKNRKYFKAQGPFLVQNNGTHEDLVGTQELNVLKLARQIVPLVSVGSCPGTRGKINWESSRDTRCLDLFLLQTNWAKVSEGVDPNLAQKYVASWCEEDKKESTIADACFFFLTEASSYIPLVSRLTLRYLGPDWNGESKLGHRAFKAVQEDKTLHRYATVLTRLVLMVWRRAIKTSYSKMEKLSETAMKAGRAMNECLVEDQRSRGDSPVVQQALMKVLSGVFCVILEAHALRKEHTVSQFLMLANLRDDGSWLGPADAGYLVAALKYACRCTVLLRIRQEQPTHERMLQLCRFVLTNRNTAFCAMTEVMNMAASAKMNESWAVPRVAWCVEEEPWTALMVGGEVVSLRSLQTGLRKQVSIAEEFMASKLLFGMNIDEDEKWKIALSSVKDDPRNPSLGFGITDERCNPRLAGMNDRLVTHIMKNNILRSRFIKVPKGDNEKGIEGKNIWKKEPVAEWMEKVVDFLELLLPIVHVVSGQPARAEELATISVRNSKKQRRNVYWMYNTVMILTRYHKSQNVTGSSKSVPRFLPRELVPLFLKYLALVKPLEAGFAEIVFCEKEARQSHARHLWCKRGKRWRGRDVCDVFEKQMHTVVGFGLRLSDYRHVCIAFVKALITHKFPGGFADGGEEWGGSRSSDKGQVEWGQGSARETLDSQAGHSSEIAERIYGVSEQDVEEISAGELLAYWLATGEYGKITGYYLDGMDGWRVPPSTLRAKRSEEGRGCCCSGPREVHFARAVEERFCISHKRKRSVSSVFDQDSLLFNSGVDYTNGVQSTSKRRRRHKEKTALRVVAECGTSNLPLPPARSSCSPCSMVPSESALLLKYLREFLQDPLAEFTSSHQALSVREVFRAEKDVLIVMPTGSGKTLTYMLPAWMEQKNGGLGTECGKLVTIVIVPLVALTDDLMRRCSERGIVVDKWSIRDTSKKPTILFVSVEAAGTDVFRRYCGSLVASGCLSRIVIEEAHGRITWQGYRPQMHSLSWIRPSIPTTLVLLTGTLPPSMEPELSSGFFSPFEVIRMRTLRKNLHYSVIKMDEPCRAGKNMNPWDDGRVSVHKRVIELMRETLSASSCGGRPWALEDRFIVYCMTQSDCGDIVSALSRCRDPKISSTCYHRGMDEEKRKKSVREWMEATGPVVMVATSSFGTGIDYPSVRGVIHVGGSYSFLDYAQETGRAGRDGKLAQCTMVTHRYYLKLLERMKKKEKEVGNFEKIGEKIAGVGVGSRFESDAREDEEFERTGIHHHPSRLDRPGVLLEGAKDMLQFIYREDEKRERKCRRQVLQSFLDGSGANCLATGDGCVACDVCREEIEKLEQQNRDASGNLLQYTQPQTNHSSRQQEEAPFVSGEQSLQRGNPERIVQEATRRANETRNSMLLTYMKARTICERLLHCCIYCTASGKERHGHSESDCVLATGRCFRCMEGGHSGKRCLALATGMFRERPVSCFRCGVKHDNEGWGSQCTTNFSVARDLALALWTLQRQWLDVHFPDLTRIRDVGQYGKWLYGIMRETQTIRVLNVIVEWWEKEIENDC